MTIIPCLAFGVILRVISSFLTGEIALLEGLTVVYKSNIDLYFYVIGSSHENEVKAGSLFTGSLTCLASHSAINDLLFILN